MHAGFWWGNLRDGDQLEDPRADWIIFKCISKSRTELLAQDRNSRCCGHGYERLGSVKYWELLHQVSIYQFLSEGSASGSECLAVQTTSLNMKAPRILRNVQNHSTTQRHLPRPESSTYDRKMGGPQSQHGRCGGDKNRLPCRELIHDLSVFHIKLHLFYVSFNDIVIRPSLVNNDLRRISKESVVVQMKVMTKYV